MEEIKIITDILNTILPSSGFPPCEIEASWKERFYLPPDLLCMCISYLVEECKEYWDNGVLNVSGFRVEGMKHGTWRIWYNNGSLKSEANYTYGNLNGEYKAWFSNGQLSFHTFYVDRKENGDYKTWWTNGVLTEHTVCVNGKKHGESRRYMLSGELGEQGSYVHGKKEGEWIYTYPTEKSRGFYVNGKRNGKWVECIGIDGIPITMIYDNGKYIQTL